MSSVIPLLVVLIILGLASWVVDRAPFIDASFKGFIKWVLIVVGVVFVVGFLLGVAGLSSSINLK